MRSAAERNYSNGRTICRAISCTRPIISTISTFTIYSIHNVHYVHMNSEWNANLTVLYACLDVLNASNERNSFCEPMHSVYNHVMDFKMLVCLFRLKIWAEIIWIICFRLKGLLHKSITEAHARNMCSSCSMRAISEKKIKHFTKPTLSASMLAHMHTEIVDTFLMPGNQINPGCKLLWLKSQFKWNK